MPKYVIERDIPKVGALTREELRAASQRSCGVLHELGTEIQWIQSYVTDDRLYCVYLAPNAALIERHAAAAGFPANRISELRGIIEPATAE